MQKENEKKVDICPEGDFTGIKKEFMTALKHTELDVNNQTKPQNIPQISPDLLERINKTEAN